jgi:hypothetical protein
MVGRRGAVEDLEVVEDLEAVEDLEVAEDLEVEVIADIRLKIWARAEC